MVPEPDAGQGRQPSDPVEGSLQIEEAQIDDATIGINLFGRRPAEDGLRALARHGYRAVDYSAAAGRLAGDRDALAGARRLAADLGLRPAGTHFRSFGVSFLTSAEGRAAFVRDSVEDVRAAAFLGVPAVAFHLSNALEPQDGPSPEASDGATPRESHDRLAAANAEAFREAVRVAEGEGVAVALENHYRGFGERAEDLRAVAALLDSPAVGFTLDSGHAVVSGQRPADLARAMGSRLLLTHLHDNDGTADTHRPAGRAGPSGAQAGPAVVDWPALIEALRAVGYPGRNAWMLEGGTQVPGDDVEALLAAHLAAFRGMLTLA
jgi:sugar phosphate isomerase/epimerase